MPMKSIVFGLIIAIALAQTPDQVGPSGSSSRTGMPNSGSAPSNMGPSGDTLRSSHSDNMAPSGDMLRSSHSGNMAPSGDMSHSGDREGSHSGNEERHVEVEISDHGATVTSTGNEQREDGSKNKLQFEVNSPNNGNDQGGLRLQLHYFHDKADATPKASIGVAFAALIEFHEQSGTFNGYTEGQDTVVRQFNLSALHWGVASLPDTTQADGSVVSNFMVQCLNADSSALLQLMFHTSTAQFQVNNNNNKTFPAGTLKIDVAVPNFQYGSSGSHLALMAKVQSANSIVASQSGQAVVQNEGASASFSWESQFTAQGVDLGQVVASQFQASVADGSMAGQQALKTFFSFSISNAKAIFWDPTLSATDLPFSASPFLGVSLLLLLASFIFSFF